MSPDLYVVRYRGPFGYIKPWTAVRDSLTFSQTFLTPSILEGMRIHLDVSEIVGHRIQHSGISEQLERVQPAAWTFTKKGATRERSILTRGVMIEPRLYLAFTKAEDAAIAARTHLCLCRNEDLLWPEARFEISQEAFDGIPGCELLFGESTDSFLVGFDRFNNAAPMYGRLRVVQGSGGAE